MVLRVHFLNVGHGDCTIIAHPSGRMTMIDINTSQDYDWESYRELLAEETAKRANPFYPAMSPYPPVSLGGLGGLVGIGGLGSLSSGNSLGIYPLSDAERAASEDVKRELADPIAFMQKNYPGNRLWRFILTHPDLDHMRGIKRLYDTIGFDNFWDTANTKPTPNYRSDDDKIDWEFYQSLRSGTLGLTPRQFTRGACLYAFGRDENGVVGGDNIEVLSPSPGLVDFCNAVAKSNDLSMVLRVTHANRSVLLPGDAEDEAWDEMRSSYGGSLKSDFLKASHHGRDSGFNIDAVKLIAPLMTFVSVGRKPDTDASHKYRAQCDRVVSTRYYGNIELRIEDDGACQWFHDREGTLA